MGYDDTLKFEGTWQYESLTPWTFPKGVLPETRSLSGKLDLFMGLLFGILGTIGGWWMFLNMIGFGPLFSTLFDEFSPIGLLLGMCGLSTILTVLLFGGPCVIRDAIVSYRKEAEEQ